MHKSSNVVTWTALIADYESLGRLCGWTPDILHLGLLKSSEVEDLQETKTHAVESLKYMLL